MATNRAVSHVGESWQSHAVHGNRHSAFGRCVSQTRSQEGGRAESALCANSGHQKIALPITSALHLWPLGPLGTTPPKPNCEQANADNHAEYVAQANVPRREAQSDDAEKAAYAHYVTEGHEHSGKEKLPACRTDFGDAFPKCGHAAAPITP